MATGAFAEDFDLRADERVEFRGHMAISSNSWLRVSFSSSEI
jgi:hypothetical protein